MKISQGTNLATQGNLPDDKAELVDGADNAVMCEAYHWLTCCQLFKERLCEKGVFVTVVFSQVTWLVLAQSRVFVKFPPVSRSIANIPPSFIRRENNPNDLSTNLASPRAVPFLTKLIFEGRIALLVCPKSKCRFGGSSC